MKSREFFIVAAEESANQYVARLMDRFLKDSKFQDVKFSGIGFKGLEEKGFNRLFPAEDLSVMGLLEVAQKWKKVKEAFSVSLRYISENKPAAVLLVDFGGFNLKLAAAIKKKSPQTKVLYFISPKLWAWGAKRALKVKAFVDKMYVIHPFEVDFYKKWGVAADFVGHPLLQDLKDEYFDEAWKTDERAKLGFAPESKVVGFMMGSRPAEIKRLKAPFVETIKKLKVLKPDIEVACIIPPSKDIQTYEDLLADSDFDFKILHALDPMERIALCDVVLVASGTATLQVGILGIPMAIAYIMNPVTMFLAKTFVTGIKYAGLVNIISEREISKEFLQGDVDPAAMSSYLHKLLTDETFYNERQKDLLSLRRHLGSEQTYEKLFYELISYL